MTKKAEHRLLFLTIICLLLESQVSSFSNVVGIPLKVDNLQRCSSSTLCNTNTAATTIHRVRVNSRTHSRPTLALHKQHQTSSSASPSSPSSSKTALSMGLRSFLRRGKGGGDDKNNKNKNGSEEPDDIKAALEAIKADLEAVTQKEKEEKLKKKLESSLKGNGAAGGINSTRSTKTSASIGGSGSKSLGGVSGSGGPSSASSSSKSRVKTVFNEMKKITSPTSSTPTSRYGETVRDRVKRVKSGDMTEDEKLAFLNNALTPRTTPQKKGPRIRQAIPEAGDGRMSSSRSKSPSSSSSASSAAFRNDPLWNRVLGNAKQKDKGMSRSPYNIEDVVGSDSAKRQYLDMVTDPNRFSSYAAMGGYKSRQPPNDNESNTYDNGEESGTMNSTTDDDVNIGGVFENLKNVFTNEKEEDDPDSLANRLQSAAIIKEKQDAEMKAKRDLERKAEKERIAEAQRQAAEEIRRREEEKIQQAKEAEERIMREEQEKREVEENRQRAILAAQEEYWAKQLQKDKGRGGVVMSDEDKQRNLQQVTMALGQKSEIDDIRSRQRDESDILQKVRIILSLFLF